MCALLRRLSEGVLSRAYVEPRLSRHHVCSDGSTIPDAGTASVAATICDVNAPVSTRTSLPKCPTRRCLHTWFNPAAPPLTPDHPPCTCTLQCPSGGCPSVDGYFSDPVLGLNGIVGLLGAGNTSGTLQTATCATGEVVLGVEVQRYNSSSATLPDAAFHVRLGCGLPGACSPPPSPPPPPRYGGGRRASALCTCDWAVLLVCGCMIGPGCVSLRLPCPWLQSPDAAALTSAPQVLIACACAGWCSGW